MAQFDTDMFDVIQALQKADLFDEESQTRLLKIGSSSLIEQIDAEARRSQYNLKFISPKLKAGKIKKNKNGDYTVTVTVNGKNPAGERLATIAFVFNYGRQKKYGEIKAQYFWTRAVKQTEKIVPQLYEREVTKIFQERGISDAAV